MPLPRCFPVPLRALRHEHLVTATHALMRYLNGHRVVAELGTACATTQTDLERDLMLYQLDCVVSTDSGTTVLCRRPRARPDLVRMSGECPDPLACHQVGPFPAAGFLWKAGLGEV